MLKSSSPKSKGIITLTCVQSSIPLNFLATARNSPEGLIFTLKPIPNRHAKHPQNRQRAPIENNCKPARSAVLGTWYQLQITIFLPSPTFSRPVTSFEYFSMGPVIRIHLFYSVSIVIVIDNKISLEDVKQFAENRSKLSESNIIQSSCLGSQIFLPLPSYTNLVS